MEKFDVDMGLERLAEARQQWVVGRREFDAGYDRVLAVLLHEAVRVYMSVADIARALNVPRFRVRDLLRGHGLNPRDGKRVLSDQAAKALRENAELLGIKPHEMDLTSALAYLPMGEALRKELQEKTVSQVTEFPETEEPDFTVPMAERACQCKVPVSTGSLNGGVEVCAWCSYIIKAGA